MLIFGVMNKTYNQKEIFWHLTRENNIKNMNDNLQSATW